MKKLVSLLVGSFLLMMSVVPSAVALDPWIILAPILAVVDPVQTPTYDTTPSFTFSSTAAGEIIYSGDCGSSDHDAVALPDHTTVTFIQMPPGVYDNCSLRVRDTGGRLSASLPIPEFEIKQLIFIPMDFIAPTLAEVKAVVTPTFDSTPEYTFSSTEAGLITYDGACQSTDTSAEVGDNTVNFKTLSPGTYATCKIKVTDGAGNDSAWLDVTSFTVLQMLIIDTTAPSVDIVSPVATPTTDTTPNLTFSTNEVGTISYSGSCASDDVDAVVGNNTITLKMLAIGTYNNCSLRVTDISGNASAWRDIPSFTITENTTPPTDYCASFSDVSETDSDCDAIAYVKSIGAMTGNPNGTFEPDSYLQRDQIAKISLETFDLFNSGMNYCSGSPFPDVTSSAWSYQYICRGVALGMITGYADGADTGYYRPARSVNRVEFLALILRNVGDSMPGLTSTSYTDVAAGQWFSGYAKYSYDNSLFTGSKLYPERFVSRREVARVIYQLDQLGKI